MAKRAEVAHIVMGKVEETAEKAAAIEEVEEHIINHMILEPSIKARTTEGLVEPT